MLENEGQGKEGHGEGATRAHGETVGATAGSAVGATAGLPSSAAVATDSQSTPDPEAAAGIAQADNRTAEQASSGTPPEYKHWQEISGLTPDAQKSMSRKERRAALKKLMRYVQAEIDVELKEAKEDPDGRSHCWTPIPAICARIGIAEVGLSRLSKEFSGLSASEMVDVVKAKGLKERLREWLRDAYNKVYGPGGGDMTDFADAEHLIQFGMWRRILTLRRLNPDHHKNVRAIEWGFASFRRMTRACQEVYKKNVDQLEFEIIAEFAKYFYAARHLTYWRRKQEENARKRPHEVQTSHAA